MLYIVPTPLGNLEDMTPRAARVLKEVKTVYCEDTRRTLRLMSFLGLSTPLQRYEEQRHERLLDELRQGRDVALVSDGGLPGISDPGWSVVAEARREKIPVSALPGGSAVTTALAGSGLPSDSFVFLGFLPRSAGKQKKLIAAAAALNKTIAIYESPFRVVDLLENIRSVVGDEAQCCLVRELSKVHEEWVKGTVAEVHKDFSSRNEILGEFVVMLNARKQDDPDTEA
jgi:16S rRNA (cytidine1402-2'-O)-methyltransferase